MKALKKLVRLKMDDEKHLTVDEHDVDFDYPLHWHSYFELEIILRGSGKYIINDEEYDIATNNVFILSTTDSHYIEVTETTKLINISFDEELLDEKSLLFLVSSQIQKAYSLSRDEYELLIKATELLQHEYNTNGHYQRQFLQYILNCIFIKNQNRITNNICDERYRSINKAIVYMQMHFKETITLQTIADEAGYNPTYFSELFKKITGENYITFLNKLRVNYARALLANGFSVSQACFLSGYSSLSNFGVIFKKNCQMSPYEYVKASRK